MSAIEAPAILIREIELPSEMRKVEALQKDVWGCEDLDVVPLTMLAATREVGAVLIGAYDRSTLVGFVYGFPGYEAGRLTHHSHMLAVRPSYRNFNLGFRLKLAQRESVLAQGIRQITWTFDPLQNLNAYFNFVKLGVVADTYKINFYGEATSSFLHQIGTDRLWVTWPLDSQRVQERLQIGTPRKNSLPDREPVPSLVQVGINDTPQRNKLTTAPGPKHLWIEIPANVNELQKENPELAMSWREATRSAFTEALASGYLVEDFYRLTKKDPSIGVYLLSRGRKMNDFV